MIQKFVTPYSNAEIDSIDALNAALNAEESAPSEPEEPSAPSEPDGASMQPEPEPDGGSTPPEPTPKPNADEKQQYAFAQQRHEISELTELLKTMADANGIKYENKNDLIAKLKDKALVERATQQNIPVELLREVEQLRADSNQWKKYQHEQAAMQGFNRLTQDYGLDQQALEAFAIELDQAGRNPFTQNIDVVSEYKARHLDDIVSARVQAAVEAALRGDAVASQNSSTPPRTQGTGGAGEGNSKISTVAQLTKLLQGG